MLKKISVCVCTYRKTKPEENNVLRLILNADEEIG